MIKNYTSETPAVVSIGRIVSKLVAFGATAVQQEYAEKKLVGVSFIIPMPDGSQMPIRLPARVKQIEILLRKEIRKPQPGTFERITQQSERTAWKLLADWVDVQLSLVQLEQVEFLEVFLPYVYRPQIGKTFYEQMKEGGLAQLALPRAKDPVHA